MVNNKVSLNEKYDSKTPSINSINFNVGGKKPPFVPINPNLNHRQAFCKIQMSVGAFNSSQFQSSAVPTRFCVL